MTERRIAVYPASFDPITNGHLDLIERASRLFDEVVVAVAINVEKSGGTFPLDERLALMREARGGRAERARRRRSRACSSTTCARIGARIVIRGLRALADFEYEFEMALMNNHMFPEIETVFLMTSERWFYVSASRVRELVRFGADVSRVRAARRSRSAEGEARPEAASERRSSCRVSARCREPWRSGSRVTAAGASAHERRRRARRTPSRRSLRARAARPTPSRASARAPDRLERCARACEAERRPPCARPRARASAQRAEGERSQSVPVDLQLFHLELEAAAREAELAARRA